MRSPVGPTQHNQGKYLSAAIDWLRRSSRFSLGVVPSRRTWPPYQERADAPVIADVESEDDANAQRELRGPVLSVAIPTFNRSETLRRQLGSLLGQIVGCQHDVEVVVSDNASSDGTESVVAEIVNIPKRPILTKQREYRPAPQR